MLVCAQCTGLGICTRTLLRNKPLLYTPTKVSLELELVVDIWRVLCASLRARMHLARVVPFNAALLVSAKGIARKV